ncbi:hypothetical protein [Thioflexithrix psekupsensis]|uniref:DUF4412 domain-containing protein n=1 Tax=Thioflexithrix psekupsensis TaxID=1570016 RepID=A0A251X8U7_9GAMM|nr:hypothetical protein [Thioflexithrix psekupsensis]OUD14147.1 hypothetical protein TPSD3_07380 [Thioflexithrix psekupsensis]
MRFNKHLAGFTGLLYSTLLSANLWAGTATVIQHHDQSGKIQKITITETKARMDSDRPERYMILDLEAQKMFAVDGLEKQVMEVPIKAGSDLSALSPNMPNVPDAPPVKTALVEKGEGQPLLGYPTRHYQITANDQVCSDNYVSAQASDIAHLQNFLTAMSELTHSRRAMMKMAFAFSPCLFAQSEQEGALMTKGIVLKSIDNQGRIVHQMDAIQTDVSIDEQLFAIPSDYPVLTEQQMMQKRMEQMQQMQQQFRQAPPPPPSMPSMPPAGQTAPQYRPLN